MLFQKFQEGKLKWLTIDAQEIFTFSNYFRFLKPSQVKGVDTDAFLRNQHLSKHIHENSVLGYRGLLGKNVINIANQPLNSIKSILTKKNHPRLQ